MQFNSFHSLSHHGIMSHYTMLYKYGKRTRNIWGCFSSILFKFSIFGGFFNKRVLAFELALVVYDMFIARCYYLTGKWTAWRLEKMWVMTMNKPFMLSFSVVIHARETKLYKTVSKIAYFLPCVQLVSHTPNERRETTTSNRSFLWIERRPATCMDEKINFELAKLVLKLV